MVTYRKTKSGEWVAYGPVGEITAGRKVVVEKKDGTRKVERVLRTGKPFTVNGKDMVYGYLQRSKRPEACAFGHELPVAGCESCFDEWDM